MKTKTKKTKIKSKKSKRIKKIILWCAVLGFIGWFAALRINVDANTDGYDYVIPFEEREISEYRPASGKIVLHDIEAVSTDVNQKIKKVYCKIGDKVNEGDVLCEFESVDLDEQIERIEKFLAERKAADSLSENSSQVSMDRTIQSAQLRTESARIALDSAKKAYDDTYDKYIDYYNRCYSAADQAESQMYFNMYKSYESQLDPVYQQILDAQKAYEEAKKSAEQILEEKKDSDYEKNLMVSGVEEYEKQLNKLKEEKDHLVVTAPRSGIIAESFASEGGYAMDGCLFRIGSLGKYKVEAYVSSSDILEIKPGMEASVKTILTGADQIKAKVLKVSDVFSVANNGYAVEIELTDEANMDSLRHNSTAMVRIYSNYIGMVPAVQYDAIAEDESGNAYVFKAVRRGTEYIAEKVNVEKIYEGDFFVQIESADLKEGDYVVGNGKTHKNGDRLKIKGMAG